MSSSLVRCCAWLIAWGLTLTGTLSIANLRSDWGHAICGAWGCGPPLQALVACHASWLVVLVPLAVVTSRMMSPRRVLRLAIIGLAIATTSTMIFAAYDYFNWYVQASEWQRSYYLHRVGFSIITTVEAPVVEIAGISTVQLLRSLRQLRGSRESGAEILRLAGTVSSCSATGAGGE